MSWMRNYKYRWYETLAMNILKMGPLPKHIAFIMDGNRRFAKHSQIQKIDGHSKGFDKLTECLQWCLSMEIKEVTVFAFSIENFKRTQDEVDDLLRLAKEKFDKLLEEEKVLCENGVRIRIFGDLLLLPKDLQNVIAKAMLITEQNDKLFLNIAFAYTSHNEITTSIQEVIEDHGDLKKEDINEYLISKCLYMNSSPDPDLLIRTSGESRISDFLMWQLSSTVLYFTRALWPQLTLMDFLFGIFSYQLKKIQLTSLKTAIKTNSQNQNEICEDKSSLNQSNQYLSDRVYNFLRHVDIRRRHLLLDLTSSKKDDI
ncbi:dehydrodolichyl diphosphate synthase complex subunit DHDDS [Condylostylus longicornis]|uniref:dehydrodolichyl diphosphate synthase complex subunit DHDDS n=1 Tax=Condylostylus longicornis TaxID=2530218 RepID=UPI00244DE37B|nr:dehydrodolichyl diphosphate synthase complex subunit DHDDS [Condylostylus longicornis]